jgi:hypothetical protein
MPKLHMTDVVVSRLKLSGTSFDVSAPGVPKIGTYS